MIEAARLTGADSIHPGYGFLAESSAAAQAVEDADTALATAIITAPDAMPPEQLEKLGLIIGKYIK